MIHLTPTDVANALRGAKIMIAAHYWPDGSWKHIDYHPLTKKYIITSENTKNGKKEITETNRDRAILAYNTLEP